MQKKLLAATLVAAALAVSAPAVWALVIAPPPGPVRIVNSDAVFVGRVVEFEPIDVDAKAYPQAKDTVKYRIAVVKVTEIIKGLKDEKVIRVGFIPPTPPKPGQPPMIISAGGRQPQLQAGQEGIFMINKHHEGKFYQAPGFGYFIPMADKKFDEEVKTAKKVVTILADAKLALQSKDADERLLAASILISKYRTQKPPFPNKEEAIDAAESKLILNALASAKWGPVKFGQTNPQQLFFQIGITEKDGWQSPKKITSPNDVPNAMQAWLRANADSYRIKRFVQASDK